MRSDYEALRAETEERLIEFLHAELEIGPTFVQTALFANDEGHAEHYAQAKADAAKAAETVQRFMHRIQNSNVRSEIGNQLAELERLISTL